jgi:hypothetical protein
VGRAQPGPTEQHGLYLLEAHHGVPVVSEGHDQAVLGRYAPAAEGVPTQVIAELRIAAPPDAATDRLGLDGLSTEGLGIDALSTERLGRGQLAVDEPGVEVLIGGVRVGELNTFDAAWYRPLVERALRQGVRPGCEGHVRVFESGRLEAELFLPAGEDPMTLGPADFPGALTSAPAPWVAGGPAPASGRSRRRTGVPIWLGLTTALLILGLVGGLAYYQWRQQSERVPTTGPSAVTDTPLPAAPSPAPPPASLVAPVPASPINTAPATRLPITNGGCDPNYSGACVPIASRVECAGPGKSGPLVVRGPFRVTGTDIYQLDPDGDRIACGAERPLVAHPPPPPARSGLSASSAPAPPPSTRAAGRNSSGDRNGGARGDDNSDDESSGGAGSGDG